MPVDPITIASNEVESLLKMSRDLPRVTVHSDENILFTEAATGAIVDEPDILALSKRIQNQLIREGYSVISLGGLADVSLANNRTEVTAMLTAIGTPIQVFETWPLWKPIVTNPHVEPWRAGGTGLIPLHIDFVNCESPPEYSCLLCLVEDAAGGGQSIVSKTAEGAEQLTDKETDVLMEQVFTDGRVLDLRHVGKDVNPFAVINPHSNWRFRFTAKMVHQMQESAQKRALEAFDRHLRKNEAQFHLRAFDLLIVDQHLVVHGRMPLLGDQARIRPAERRLLHQIFLRSHKI
jgi:hypothetical protein